MNIRSKVYLLFPFDLGVELDFTGKDAKEFFKEISTRKMGVLFLDDRSFFNVAFTTFYWTSTPYSPNANVMRLVGTDSLRKHPTGFKYNSYPVILVRDASND